MEIPDGSHYGGPRQFLGGSHNGDPKPIHTMESKTVHTMHVHGSLLVVHTMGIRLGQLTRARSAPAQLLSQYTILLMRSWVRNLFDTQAKGVDRAISLWQNCLMHMCKYVHCNHASIPLPHVFPHSMRLVLSLSMVWDLKSYLHVHMQSFQGPEKA